MQLANHDRTDQIMKIYCLLVERASGNREGAHSSVRWSSVVIN